MDGYGIDLQLTAARPTVRAPRLVNGHRLTAAEPALSAITSNPQNKPKSNFKRPFNLLPLLIIIIIYIGAGQLTPSWPQEMS